MALKSIVGILPLLAFVIGVILLCRWLINKYSSYLSKRPGSLALLIIFLSAGFYYVFIHLLFFYLSYEPNYDFSVKRWMEQPDKRYTMAKDLVSSKLIIGKDSNSVKELLGLPEWRNGKIQQWRYHMGGGASGLGFQFNELYIFFNGSKAIAVKHQQWFD